MTECYATEAEKSSVLYRHLFEPFRYWYREVCGRRSEEMTDATHTWVDPDMQWSRGWEYPWVLLHGEFQSGQRVLDAGAGASPLPMMLARQGCQVVTVDDDQEGEGHREHLWGFHPELTLERYQAMRGNLHHLAYDEATFDRVVSVGVLEHLKDRDVAIAEMRRVVKPGGLLVVTEDRAIASWPGAVPPDGALVYQGTMVVGWVERKHD